MTPQLPIVSGMDCIRALEKVGYVVVRQNFSLPVEIKHE